MPEYEFYCHDCHKGFAAVMTIRDHDEKVAACPQCHKTDPVERQLSDVQVVTSKKS